MTEDLFCAALMSRHLTDMDLTTVSLQISEEELEAIAKGGGEVAMDVDMDGAGGEATRRLLGNYQTPAR